MKKLFVLLTYIVIVLGIIGGVFGALVQDLMQDLEVSPTDIVKPLPTEFAGKDYLNFLILGIGGGVHEGPTLTDSITVARLDLKTNTVHTVGIPRDVWHTDIRDKINSVYAYSLNDDHKTESFSYTKRHFSNILGMNIDSMIVVDFATFEKVIDALDGITITVKKGFIDPYFPKEGAENEECVPYDADYGCRYITLTFPKGTYEVNGKVALNFVRSRHAEGEAGGDFSRNARQQIVISAIKDKVTAIVKKHNISKLFEIVRILDSQIVKDYKNSDYLPLARKVLLSGKEFTIKSHTFTPDYFEVPPYEEYDGKYVLVPQNEDYVKFKEEIKKMLQ